MNMRQEVLFRACAGVGQRVEAGDIFSCGEKKEGLTALVVGRWDSGKKGTRWASQWGGRHKELILTSGKCILHTHKHTRTPFANSEERVVAVGNC